MNSSPNALVPQYGNVVINPCTTGRSFLLSPDADTGRWEFVERAATDPDVLAFTFRGAKRSSNIAAVSNANVIRAGVNAIGAKWLNRAGEIRACLLAAPLSGLASGIGLLHAYANVPRYVQDIRPQFAGHLIHHLGIRDILAWCGGDQNLLSVDFGNYPKKPDAELEQLYSRYVFLFGYRDRDGKRPRVHVSKSILRRQHQQGARLKTLTLGVKGGVPGVFEASGEGEFELHK